MSSCPSVLVSSCPFACVVTSATSPRWIAFFCKIRSSFPLLPLICHLIQRKGCTTLMHNKNDTIQHIHCWTPTMHCDLYNLNQQQNYNTDLIVPVNADVLHIHRQLPAIHQSKMHRSHLHQRSHSCHHCQYHSQCSAANYCHYPECSAMCQTWWKMIIMVNNEKHS